MLLINSLWVYFLFVTYNLCLAVTRRRRTLFFNGTSVSIQKTLRLLLLLLPVGPAMKCASNPELSIVMHLFSLGITVNGKIIGAEQLPPGAKRRRTYFGEIAILMKDSLKLLVYPHKVLINGQHYSWKSSNELNADGMYSHHINII